MLNTWTIKCWDREYFDIILVARRYAYSDHSALIDCLALTAEVVEIINDTPYIVEPLDHITVNIPEFKLDKGCIMVDVNSTINWEKFLTANSLAEPTGRTYQSGFVTYPEYKLSDEFIKHIEEANHGIVEAF